jgi:hypothetical protein
MPNPLFPLLPMAETKSLLPTAKLGFLADRALQMAEP